MPKQNIIDWISDPSTCFLIGCGCSKCASKPLMEDLTEKVKGKLSDNGKTLLDSIRGSHERSANVEDLITHLLRLRDLITKLKDPVPDEWTVDAIDDEIKTIKISIVKSIGTAWEYSETHSRFLRRLVGQRARKTCDLFCLNYDTLLESNLEHLKFSYTDGFQGAENAYFDPSLFTNETDTSPFFRVFKLHGSLNWVRDEKETIRRRPSNDIDDDQRIVIYPCEQKYLLTQYGVYETLLDLFRKRLRKHYPNNKLITLGYSYGDEHINLAIEDSIRDSSSNLTVYSFVGPETNIDNQIDRFSTISGRCHNRFNVAIGSDHFIGEGLDSSEWETVKTLDLWKFENLVNLIAGGA